VTRSPSLPLFLLAAVAASAVPLAGGARMGAGAVDPLGRSIRVLLLEAPLITVGAAGKQGLQLRDQTGRLLLKLDPGSQLQVRRLGSSLSLQPLIKGGEPLGVVPIPLSSSNPPTAVAEAPPEDQGSAESHSLPLQELRLEPIHPQDVLVLKQRRYRGSLLLRPEGKGLQAINRLPLESYLMGVVGSEMPSSWPLSALRAQAVASRTYALQQVRPKASFDLKATVSSQVYKGVEAESSAVRQAVVSTRGQVLLHGQQLINAVFHSSSGGRTENSGELWSRQLPYLVSVPDFDASSPVSRWQKAFAPEELRQAFGEIGGASAIEPLQTSKTGRIRQARVIGPGGELVLSGAELRERLGLRSTMVSFVFEPAERVEPVTLGISPAAPAPASDPTTTAPPDGMEAALAAPSPLTPGQPASSYRLTVQGRGYGHGVGLSQWGAYALALRGKSYEEILRHYYRGAVLRTY
jgi:stage II sporulation protein D